MKHVLLIVQNKECQLRIAGNIPIQHKPRLEEIATGDEKVMATFDCHDLTVMLQTKAGGYIILKGV